MTRLGPPRITRASYGGESSMRCSMLTLLCASGFLRFLFFILSSRSSDALARVFSLAGRCGSVLVVVWKSRGKMFYFFVMFQRVEDNNLRKEREREGWNWSKFNTLVWIKIFWNLSIFHL